MDNIVQEGRSTMMGEGYWGCFCWVWTALQIAFTNLEGHVSHSHMVLYGLYNTTPHCQHECSCQQYSGQHPELGRGLQQCF
jgi:hypothetical protein